MHDLASRPAHLPEGFTEAEWEAARPWEDYLAAVAQGRDLWESHARRVRVDADARHRLENLPARRRVLVLTEDWCGDAARSVPVLAAAFTAAGLVEHRYLDSDAHPATLGRYLTHGGRAIPMAIVQDEHGHLIGAWGPRPAPLQALVRARRRELGPPTPETRSAFFAPVLGWYGRDAGRTTVEEILMLLERGGDPR